LGVLENGTKPATGAEWTIEAGEDGNSVYLKNVHVGQYLYATEEKIPGYSGKRKIVLAPKEQTEEFKWQFAPQDHSCTTFMVQNVAYKNENIAISCGRNKWPIWTMCTTEDTRISRFEVLVKKC
jgi:hypothetical protein